MNTLVNQTASNFLSENPTASVEEVQKVLVETLSKRYFNVVSYTDTIEDELNIYFDDVEVSDIIESETGNIKILVRVSTPEDSADEDSYYYGVEVYYV